MNCALIERELRGRLFGVLCALLGLVQCASAQFVEVALQIKLTSERSSRTYDSHCLFGTNTWMIEGDFSLNAKESWWATETNIFRYAVITKKLPSSKAPPSETPAGLVFASSPPVDVGHEFSNMYGPSDKCPLKGVEYVNWLAFCSGSFLKAKGRELMPWSDLHSSGPYTDKTQTFHDALGLPERVEVYRGDGTLVCTYEVQQSTNFSGWTIPVRFTATQYKVSDGNKPEPKNVISATVTSIRKAAGPAVPAAILRRAHR